jgi:Ran-binding protein 1
LYRFDRVTNEWKERGRGDCKLLKNKATGKIRILLRQEKTLKCCMNHIVHPDLDLQANAGSDRSWTWRCTDYAGDEPETQTFALRFKDADIANAFKAKINEVRKINKDLLTKEGKANE